MKTCCQLVEKADPQCPLYTFSKPYAKQELIIGRYACMNFIRYRMAVAVIITNKCEQTRYILCDNKKPPLLKKGF